MNVGPNSFNAAIDRHRSEGVDFYFVDIPYLFDRDGIYGHLGSDYPDNQIRFGALSMAVTIESRVLPLPYRGILEYCEHPDGGPLHTRDGKSSCK